MIARHPLRMLVAALLAVTACQRSAEVAETPQAGAEALPIAGMYEVSGTTIETGTGAEREITGSVILAEDGDQYTATFHLTTIFEGEDGVLPAEVIGKGAGAIEGRTLRGHAETQLVIGSIPGIDPSFAFVPRTTTTRIVSQSLTSIAADGSVEITIENQPAPGETHPRSRTTLRGTRVASDGLPAVEVGPRDTSASVR